MMERTGVVIFVVWCCAGVFFLMALERVMAVLREIRDELKKRQK